MSAKGEKFEPKVSKGASNQENLLSRAIEILREEGAWSLFRKAAAYMVTHTVRELGFLVRPYALFKIKSLNQRSCNVDELLNFTFNRLVGLIKPSQVYREISQLLKLVDRIKPGVILEIGTANGGTLFCFSHVASEAAVIISIDLPGGKFGGGYPKWRESLYKSFILQGQKIHLLRADSHKTETLEQVEAVLHGRKVDFIFIDGDHTYEGVKKDFEMYSPLVKEGGIIAFHDIVVHPPETGCEVSKFWREIRDDYDSEEIVKDWSQNWGGIGVVYV